MDEQNIQFVAPTQEELTLDVMNWLASQFDAVPSELLSAIAVVASEAKWESFKVEVSKIKLKNLKSKKDQ